MDYTHFHSAYTLLKYELKNRKFFLAIFFVSMVLVAAEPSLQAFFLQRVIDIVAQTSDQNIWMAISIPACGYVGMNLYHNVVRRIYLYAVSQCYPALRAQLTQDIFQALAQRPVSFFQAQYCGDLFATSQQVVDSIEPLIRQFFEVFIGRCLTPVIATIFLAHISTNIAFLFIGWLAGFIFLTGLFSRPLKNLALQNNTSKSHMGGVLFDSFANIITTKIFTGIVQESSLIKSASTRLAADEKNLQLATLKLHFYQGIWTLSFLSGLILLLCDARISDALSPGDFAFALTLFMTILEDLYVLAEGCTQGFVKYKILDSALQRLCLGEAQHENPQAYPLLISQGKICFKNVRFFYPHAKEPALSDFSLSIGPKEKVGIIGLSGAGKSTLFNLCLRLYDPTDGTVEIDGHNLQNVTLTSLRQALTLIPQQCDLFHRSILDNIRYGQLSATEEEVVAAAKAAEVHNWIQELPSGYDTLVGDKGCQLSGGQKQRLLIARAYLKASPILLFDEFTSALDPLTEELVHRSMARLMEDRTVLVIAHRPAILQKMDRIIVMENGKIVEEGLREGLLSNPESRLNIMLEKQLGR